MKCPYCAEMINEEAMICRYCGRDLSYYKLYRSMLERLSSLEDKVSEIHNSRNTPLPVDNALLSSGEKRSTAAAIREAIRYVIDSATATEIDWRQIILAVLLSSSVQVLSNQIWNLTDLIPYSQNLFINNLAGAALTIVTTILRLGSVFSPLIFGFWASLAWPGKHTPSYVLLGLIAGLLTLNGQLGLDLLGGLIPWLPSDTPLGTAGPTWISGFDRIQWVKSLVWLFIGPASVFVAGALLGDLAKWRRFPQRERERGLTYKVLGYFSISDKEPSKLAVVTTQISQAIVSIIIPYVLSSLFDISANGTA